MPSSEQYERSAEECRKLAELTKDEAERAMLLTMADQWMLLAEHKAKREAGR